ncbi:MAG: carboxypeptidase regulatory-like domain-containing protein, partial [Pyrinomonadaceae bacterium]|nr:carboxypeptidase regulatory-like domain-containing protein [Pyrinomonadaceae bacterium]
MIKTKRIRETQKGLRCKRTAVSATLARCAALLILSGTLSINVFAQGGASVTGRVTDERGANVVGAEVRLRSRGGVALFARTNVEGVYGFTGLGPGEYVLEVKADGFAAQSSEDFRVERGAELSRSFQLSVA